MDRIGSRGGGSDNGELAEEQVFEGGKSRRPVVKTGLGVNVIIVGSGGGGYACWVRWLEGGGFCEEIDAGEASFL